MAAPTITVPTVRFRSQPMPLTFPHNDGNIEFTAAAMGAGTFYTQFDMWIPSETLSGSVNEPFGTMSPFFTAFYVGAEMWLNYSGGNWWWRIQGISGENFNRSIIPSDSWFTVSMALVGATSTRDFTIDVNGEIAGPFTQFGFEPFGDPIFNVGWFNNGSKEPTTTTYVYMRGLKIGTTLGASDILLFDGSLTPFTSPPGNYQSGSGNVEVLLPVVVVPPDPTDGSPLEPVTLTVSSLGSCPPVAEGVSGILTLSVLEECPSPSAFVLPAGTLYAAKAGGATTTSNLYTVSPTTAVASSVGPTGFALTGLAFDPTTGILYGATSTGSAAHPRSLVTIDPVTGIGTYVGTFTSSKPVPDISFDPDGQLWGYDASAGALARIDKGTAGISDLSPVDSFNGYSGLGFGLDIDSFGACWVFPNTQGGNPPMGGNFFTFDLDTGDVTLVDTLVGGTGVYPTPIPAVAFDSNDVAWALGGGAGGSSSILFHVSVPDPNLTEVGTIGGGNWDALVWRKEE